MRAVSGAFLRARVLWELTRYDLLFAFRGLNGVRPERRQLAAASQPAVGPQPAAASQPAAVPQPAVVPQPADLAREAGICETVSSVAPFYWKPIRCLQRSIVTARLMRRHGIPAEVVIGYRPVPFFSHAWVEVGGRAANDSPSYQMRLQVLERL